MSSPLRLAVLAGCLMALACARASAEDRWWKPVPDSDEREPKLGWYFGGGVGGFRIVPAGFATANSDKAFGGLGILGYSVYDNVNFELRLGGTTSVSGGENFPVGSPAFPFTFGSGLAKIGTSRLNRIQVYGVVGATIAHLGTVGSGTSTSKGSVSVGGGADFDITPNISLGAEYVRYLYNQSLSDGSQISVDGATVTLRYRF